METFPKSTKELIEQSQESLIDFIRLDTEVAFTFLQGAAITSSVQHRKSALLKAEEALRSIRHFITRVKDPQKAGEQSIRADQLRDAIANFQPKIPARHL